jgi:DNA primase
MDVIGLAAAGYDEAVAPLGTALTEEQMQALWRLVPEPILCFDPDAAGQRAAMRACERALPLIRAGLGLRFAFLGTGTGDDPDQVARRYPRQFLAHAFADALPLSAMLVWLETAGRPPASPEARARVAERLRQRAFTITDRELREQFLAAFREALRPNFTRGPDAAGRHRRGTSREPAASASSLERADPSASGGVAHAERMLLAILLHYPELFAEVEEAIGSMTFGRPELERLRQELVSVLSGAEPPTPARLADRLQAAGLAAERDGVLENPFVRRLIAAGAPLDSLRSNWRHNLARIREATARADAQASVPSAEVHTLARRLAEQRAALQLRDDDTVD